MYIGYTEMTFLLILATIIGVTHSSLTDTCDYSVNDRCGGVCVNGEVDCECGNSTFNNWAEDLQCCHSSSRCSTNVDTRNRITDVHCNEGGTFELRLVFLLL